MNVVIAILIFASLIIVHEFGHFVAAKRVGIQVDEFAIGIGPVLFDVQRGETTYSWRLFPVLGFVRMAGTDLEDEALPGRGFRDKTVWQRKAVCGRTGHELPDGRPGFHCPVRLGRHSGSGSRQYSNW